MLDSIRAFDDADKRETDGQGHRMTPHPIYLYSYAYSSISLCLLNVPYMLWGKKQTATGE